MDQVGNVEAQAMKLEEEAVQLEKEQLMIAAAAKLQQPRTLRVNADLPRQQHSGNSFGHLESPASRVLGT